MTDPAADYPIRQDLIEEGAYAALATHSAADSDDPYIWRKVSEAVLDAFLTRLAERGVIGLVSGLRDTPLAAFDQEDTP